MKNKIKRMILALLCLFVIIPMMVVPVSATEEDNTPEETVEKRVVRVGCALTTGYHEQLENGKLTGYGYSYEQIMAQYVGWDIEYVEGSWSELQQKLEAGEIDLLGFLVKNQEREQIYDFADSPSGVSMSCLITLKSNSKYTYQNYEAFDGMTIACQGRNANLTSFLEYARENHFNVNMQYYDTYREVYEAIESGKADAGLMTNFQDVSEYSVIDQFLPVNFYYAVPKGNKELLTEVNEGISDINTYFSDISNTLYQTFYDKKNGRNSTFTQEELDYLSTKPTVYVVPGGREQPYEYYDTEQGKYVGIVPDILDRITANTGIHFEYYQTNDRWVFQHEDIGNNVITSLSCDIAWAKENELFMTQPFTDSNLALIRRNKANNAKTVALVQDRYISQLVEERHPEWTKNYFKDKQECLEAVKNGVSDCTIMNSYEADYFLSLGKYHSLKEDTFPGFMQNICFGVSYKSDPLLYGIMSKAILMIPTEEYSTLVRQHIYQTGKATLEDIIYLDPVHAIFVVVCVSVLVMGVVGLLIYTMSIRKKNKIIMEANQAKSDFLSKMSHDIRTPMNTIMNLTKLVENELDDHNAVLMDLHKIESSNEFLLSLVNDILDMSRIEKGKMELHPERYSYGEFLDYMHSTFDPISKQQNIELIIQEGSQDVDIIMDKVRFNQLCFNLVSNAIKYTPNGGHVTFKMVHGEIVNDMLPCDIYVSDDGIGMSKEFQKNMFQPFSQEGRAYKTVEGTGLGLSIVKEIVDLLGGTIDVESEVDKGTTFHIYLEMLLAPQQEVCEEQEKNKLANLQGKHILIVEDHPLNQEIAKRLLSKVGAVVTIANNGQEGVETFEKNPELYDAILMDMRMPVMDGLSATREIRKLTYDKAKEIPIIAMTANAFVEDRKASEEAGLNAHLSKPVNPEELYQTLKILIGRETEDVRKRALM